MARAIPDEGNIRAWLPEPPAHHRGYAESGLWRDCTIADLALEWAGREPDRPVFLEEESPPTYATLADDGEALARALRDLGLRPGDVVSFQLPNWYEAAVINLACAFGGFVANPIITIYRDAEVRQMLADCRAQSLFLCDTHRGYDFAAMLERIRPDLPDLRHVIRVRGERPGLHYGPLLETGRGRADPLPQVDPDGVKMLLYTSGTTGRPKAVLHSHNTLERMARAAIPHWGYRPGDIMLMPSPVTHISGYGNGLEMPFYAGTRTWLMQNWNAQEAIALIDDMGVNLIVAATPFLQELTQAARAAGTSLPSLRFFGCGGAAVPPEIVRAANRHFARPCVRRIYGSSEVPLVTLGYPAEKDAEVAAVTDGQIVDYSVRIVDEVGNDVPHGAEGEIWARGPAMFLGYANARETDESITPGGYFRTGDLGQVTDAGALMITGRKKDLIIRGGENISAKEIEDALHTHAGIIEAAVVSMPHERLGEGICAFVVARPGRAFDVESLGAIVTARGLANQKRPERVIMIDTLPKTAAGKVRKDVLRVQARHMLPA